MRDSEYETCARSAATYSYSYSSVVEALQRKYDRPQVNYILHFKSFLTPHKREYTRHSMEELVKHFNQIQRGMHHCKGYTVVQLFGVQLEASFSLELKHEWTVASEDINTPPTEDELLEFLQKRLLNLPNEGIKLTVPSSSSTSSNNQSSKKARVSHVKSKEIYRTGKR